MALFRTLPTPTYDLLPCLMVEVCLVLAPDVNFFRNSRKQELPCWRSLSFFLSFLLGLIEVTLETRDLFTLTKNKKTTQAAKSSSHQLRKRGHLGR